MINSGRSSRYNTQKSLNSTAHVRIYASSVRRNKTQQQHHSLLVAPKNKQLIPPTGGTLPSHHSVATTRLNADDASTLYKPVASSPSQPGFALRNSWTCLRNWQLLTSDKASSSRLPPPAPRLSAVYSVLLWFVLCHRARLILLKKSFSDITTIASGMIIHCSYYACLNLNPVVYSVEVFCDYCKARFWTRKSRLQ